MTQAVFDYVIVGGGTAGCVLANRLTADGSTRVLMLEAGPRDNYLWIHIPIGYGKTMFHPVYNWGFYTEPEPEMKGRKIYWPRGRGLGGSSSINGLIYVRGQPQDYDAWAAAGNRGWGWNDVLPYFIRSEGNQRGASATHGGDGPLACSDIGAKHELIEAIIAGAGELGVPRTDDFNGGVQEGAGYYQLFTKNGLRCSSAVGYLRPAQGAAEPGGRGRARRPRASCSTASRAVGVEYRQDGETKRVTARARSDTRRRFAAKPAAAAVVGHRPGSSVAAVRHSRRPRPCPAWARTCRTTCSCASSSSAPSRSRPTTTSRSTWRSAKIGLQWLLRRTGPLAVGINQGGLFTRVLPESTRPDIQFHFATLSADLAGAKPHPFSGFTMSVCQLRPTSRGHVRIKSADPLAAPAMQPNYLATDADRRCAVAGVKFARRLAATAAMRPYVLAEYRPGSAATSDADLLDFAREFGATIFHPSGTCSDGIGPASRGRRPVARSRRGRPARGRLLDHADAGLGQHQRARRDDRREGERPDPRGPVIAGAWKSILVLKSCA